MAPPNASPKWPLFHLRKLDIIHRYKDRLPKLSPMHYAAAFVLLMMVLFNNYFFGGYNKFDSSSHCVDLDQAVEATVASMRHASSRSYPKGFCQRLPLHQSAPWLWNTEAPRILEATYDPRRDGGTAWLADAFRVLQPMALSTRGRPQHEVWGHFVNKIELRLSERDLFETSDPIKVLILASPYDVTTSCSMRGRTTPEEDCSWPSRLQNVVDEFFGEGIIDIAVQVHEYATTNLLTYAVKTNQVGVQNADMVIYAMTSQELYQDSVMTDVNLARPIDSEGRMGYYQRLLLRIQNLIRTILESQPCQEFPPPILLVDDYVGNLHDKLLVEYSMTRALQQLADHYRIGYISYPHLVRKLVLTDTMESLWAPDWSRGTNIQHGRSGHVGILWTLLYNALEYTIDYCSHESDITEYRKVQKTTKLVQEWVFDRLQQPVPYLNGDLLWTNVSPRWKEAGDQFETRKRNVCAGRQLPTKARQCSLSVWGGRPNRESMTVSDMNDLLRPYVQRMTGFTILNGGVLRATQANAVLELIVHDDLDVDQVALFLGPGDLQILQDPVNQLDSAEVKFSIATGGSNNTVSTNINLIDRTSVEQEIPEIIPGQAIRLTIELITGVTVDVTGLFLCTSEEIAF